MELIGKNHSVDQEWLILEICVPVEPKHSKHVLKLHCNWNAVLARGATTDLIV